MTNCGCYTDVPEELPSAATAHSTSPDPRSCRIKTAMFAANPYMPPDCFGASVHSETAHRADCFASQAPSATMPDNTLVAGVASLLALRYQHVQACVRASNDKEAKRDQVEPEWMNSSSAAARESFKELRLIANVSDARSDEPFKGNEEDADFDVLSLLCSPSGPVWPCSATKTRHVFGDGTAKFRALSQQRQQRCSQPFKHLSSMLSGRESSNELQLIANMSDANYEPIEGYEEDADFDLLSLLCSLSEPVWPCAATKTRHVSGDDTAKFHALSKQRHTRGAPPHMHPSSVLSCLANVPQIPAAPKCVRPSGRRRPHVAVGIFQQG